VSEAEPGAVGHPAAAARFLRDGERARWHDAALWHVRARRDAAVAALPEWEALREEAAAVRRHTLARLGDYLEQFERNATRLGARVHFAADAAEHNAIVLGILRERGARRVVKSKSMLTEECGLNAHLERHGVEVVDTDLGERIVQLRREAPSHIVLPAIHLRKREIGELFAARLGSEPGLEDPGALAEVARRHLRAAFLSAEAGITGANFALADSGGIVICTNEGNADLGIALPPLHVACLGIEKLLPRAADLGLFLRLLARSATGQAITAYSSHVHGPRPGGELHIVLVDNGRSALLADPALGDALACIRCGACLNTCPVYRRSGGHSYATPVAGPIGSVLAPAGDLARHRSLPSACSLCGSCREVCPVRIDLPAQLVALRGRVRERGLERPGRRLAARGAAAILARPRLYAALGALARRLLRLWPEAGWRRSAWGRERARPRPPAASFREQWRRRGR
jgi:L-lactate dehydrogenase complex protein LldF